MELYLSSGSQTFSNLSNRTPLPPLFFPNASLGWKKRNWCGWIGSGGSDLCLRGASSPHFQQPLRHWRNLWCSMEPSLRIDLKGSAVPPFISIVFYGVFRRILSRILTSALWRKDSEIVPWPAKIRHAFLFRTSSHLDYFEMEMLVYQETETGQRVTHTLNFFS